MKTKNLFLILGIIFLFVSLTGAKDFNIFNSSLTSQSYFLVNGTTGLVYANGQLVGSGTLNSTGWNSTGAKVFLANTSAYVGIGTTNPIYGKLQVTGTSTGVAISSTDTTSPYLFLLANSGNNGVGVISLNDGGIMKFDTGATGAGQATKMTILSGGNVGIGTTSPGTPLEVSFNNGAYGMPLTLRNTNTTGSVYNGIKFITSGTEAFHILSTTSSTIMRGITSIPFDIYTNNTNRFRIDASGNVGIGTTAPGQKLDVQAGTSAVNSAISGTIGNSVSYTTFGGNFQNTGTGTGTTYGVWGSATGVATTNIGGYFSASGATNNYGLIVSAGNVGIGTTAPTVKLDVAGVINATNLLINGTAVSTTTGTLTGTGTAWYIPMWNGTTSLNNSGIYQNGGNIGIGTTTPLVKLHIDSGTTTAGLAIEGNETAVLNGIQNELIFSYASPTTFPNAKIVTLNTGGADSDTIGMAFYTHTSALSIDLPTEKMRITHDGNVGIGTTAPLRKLMVDGAGTGGAILRLSKQSGTAASFDFNVQTDYMELANGAGTNIMTWKETGNIGIGTTAPGYKLEVSTTADTVIGSTATAAGYASMFKATNNAGSAIFGQNGMSTGSLVLAGTLNYATVIAAPATQAIQLAPGAAPSMTLLSTGNVGIGTTSPATLLNLNSTGNTTLRIGTTNHANTNKLEFYSVTGAFHSIQSNANSGSLQIRAGDGGSGHEIEFYIDGTIAGAFDSNNRLAIGKTTADYAVDVVGDVNAYRLLINGTAIGSGTLTGTGTAWYIPMWNGTTSLNNSGIYQNGSNVGIGTTAPVYKLEVSGGGIRQSNGGYQIDITGGRIETNRSDGLYLQYGQASGRLTIQPSNGVQPEIVFTQVNGSNSVGLYRPVGMDYLRTGGGFLVDGNVGIGTTTPGAKLQINGTNSNLFLTSSNDDLSYIELGSNSSNYGWLIGKDDAEKSLGSGSGRAFVINELTSGQKVTRFLIDRGGNVGIGTTNPRTKFSIGLNDSSVNTVQYLRFQNEASGYVQWAMEKTGSNDLTISNLGTGGGDTPIMTFQYVASGGNVGIGTTSPTQKLEVSGNANVTGNMTIGNAQVYTDTSGDMVFRV